MERVKGTIIEVIYYNEENCYAVIGVENPEMDFVFERRVDEKSFTLDTRQLRDVLGDVPLNNPEVALWISSFLEENEKDLFGGKDQ